jgi:hypothetical protein
MGGPMTVTFKLELTDGRLAEPPSIRTGVYVWRPGDTIPIRADRTLRVVRVRSADEPRPGRRGHGR